MALNFGSIFGSLTVDTTGWTRKLDAAFKAGDQRLAQSTKRYGTEGGRAGENFAGGVEAHTKGIGAQLAAVVDRVPAVYGREGAQGGERFAQGVQRQTTGLAGVLGRAVDGVKARFGKAGSEAGDGFSTGVAKTVDGRDMFRGVDTGLSTVKGKFSTAGHDAGDEFGQGVEKGADGFGTRLGQIISNSKTMLATAAATVGAAIGAVLVDSLLAGWEAERVGDRVAAQLGLLGDRAAEIGSVAGELYFENFGDSVEQVGEAVQLVFRNGLVPMDATRAEVKQTAADLLMLADVLDQDLSMAAEAVGNIMRNGLAPDVETAMDIVSAAIIGGADKAGDLAETFQEYSVQFRELGLTGAEAAGLMVQGLLGGARDADTIADALKELVIRSKEAVSTQKDTAAEVESASRRIADARRRVGDVAQQSADRMVAADERIVDMQRNAMRAQKALTDARAAAQQQLEDLASQSEDAAMSEESAALAVERARERLNEVNADPQASALDRREADLAYRQAVKQLEDQKKRVIDLAAAKADADAKGVDGSTQVLDAFFGVIEANKNIEDATVQRGRVQVENDRAAGDAARDLRDAQNDLSAANQRQLGTLTPIGNAYKTLGLDGTKMQEAFANGGDDARFALQLLLDKLREIEDPVLRNQIAIDLFGTKAEDLQGALDQLDPKTAVAALGEVEGATDRLKGAYDNAATDIDGWKRKFEGLFYGDGFFSPEKWDAGVETIRQNLGMISGVWGMMETSVGDTVARLGLTIATKWEQIKTWVSDKVNRIVATVSTAWDSMVETVRGLPDRITTAATGLWDSISGGVAIVKQWISDRWDEMVDTVTGLPDRIADAASGMWDGIKDAFKDALNWIIDKWNGLEFTIPSIDVPGLGTIGGNTFSTPNIPRFHTGTGAAGVPGPLGQERLALVQAGERIYTAQQARALDRTMASMGGQASAGLDGIRTRPSFTHTSGPVRYPMGGDGATIAISIPVTFAGPVAGRDGERWVTEQISNAARKGVARAVQIAGVNGRVVVVQ